jgi:hypothetical protein
MSCSGGGLEGNYILESLSAKVTASRSVNMDPERESRDDAVLTMAGLAANRRYAYQSIGALGVIELTAPERAAAVSKGLRRLGVVADDRRYFDLHAVLDVKHSQAWNANVLHPLVREQPETARAIAEGALMRLEGGRRCFERYRAEFGLQFDCHQPALIDSCRPCNPSG